MQETRQKRSPRAGTPQNESALDDWLGDISDDDWDEHATEQAARRHATPAHRQPRTRSRELAHESGSTRPPAAGAVPASDERRSLVERRRLAAGVALAVVLVVAIAIPVLLLSGGEQAGVTQPTTTTSEPAATSPTSGPDTTATGPSTETPTTTTPEVDDVPSFVLPEGTKLQRGGENDPALVSQLQEALVEAGFDAGPADGTFGEQTETAVVAFQQANGLSVDGRVGPETAEALNQALASG